MPGAKVGALAGRAERQVGLESMDEVGGWEASQPTAGMELSRGGWWWFSTVCRPAGKHKERRRRETQSRGQEWNETRGKGRQRRGRADGCAFLWRGRLSEAFGKVETETKNGVLENQAGGGDRAWTEPLLRRSEVGTVGIFSGFLGGWAVLLLV